MADFFEIVKIEFLGLFGINKALKTNDKKEKRKIGTFLFIMLIAGGALIFTSVMTSIAFGNIFFENGGINGIRQLPALMYTMAAILILFMGIHDVNGVLFGFKDYEILMSLPIKNRTIIAAKLCFMYILDLASCFAILIPAFVLYGWFTEAGAMFYVINSLLLFFVPLIPLGVSLIVGTLVAFISTRMRFRSLIEILLSFLFIGGVFALNLISQKQVAAIGGAAALNPFAAAFVKASCDLNIWYLLGFFVISIVAVAVLVVILEKFYKPLNSALMTKRNKTNYVFTSQKSEKVLPTLLKREFKRYFATPIYVLNTLMGAIMAIGVAVLAILGNAVDTNGETIFALLNGELKSLEGDYKIILIIYVVLPILVAAVGATSPTTSASVSLEGKTFWILKSSPVSVKSIALSKLLMDYIIFIPTTVIAEIIICAFIGAPYYVYLVAVLLGAMVAVFAGAAGLMINIYNPVMEWETEAKPIKQGMGTLYSMLVGWGGSLVVGGVLYAVYIASDFTFGLVSASIVATVLAAVSLALLFTKGIKRFEKI